MTNAQDNPRNNILHKIFGGLNMSWPVVIIFAIAMGIYTALMALLVPDGNSFHDIAVTPEWWVLPAILVIVNCKKPLEAALKVFVFFLISQPLVYLIQVPFSQMGWSLFSYYLYWFKITLATFPAGFIAWYMKKDQWYSGLILSAMTVLLAYFGINYVYGFEDSFPDHLITVIYCFAIIPVFIFGIFKKWPPRIATILVTVVTIILLVIFTGGGSKFETFRSTYSTADDEFTEFTFKGKSEVTFWSGDGEGSAELIDTGESYTIKLTGMQKYHYNFDITDETNTEYSFEYYYDSDQQTVILNLLDITTSD